MNPNKISIGTANFANKYGFKKNDGLKINEIEKILHFGYKKGIRNIDTAQAYGNSESILGNFDLKKWKISTKIKVKKNEQIFFSVDKSLRNLKIDQIENLFIHNSFDEFNKKEIRKIFNSLVELKEKKIIKNFGCSIYTPDEIDKLHEIDELEIIQAPVNIFNRKFLNKKITRYLQKKNIKLQFRSIFLQGLLLLDYENLPKKFYDWKHDFKIYQEYLEKRKLNKVMAALSVLNNVNYSTLVVGFDNKKQLKEVIENLPKKRTIMPKFDIKNDKFITDPRKW